MTRNRAEWTFIAAAAAVVLGTLGWAMVAARCSDTRDAALRERARMAPTVGARCRAMNSLCLRGYWDLRSAAELHDFLEGAPPDLRAFVESAHFTLLAERPPGRAKKGGC